MRGSYEGEATLALQSRDGARTYATQKLQGVTTDWQRFDIALKASATDANARFALWLDRMGHLYVDQVILTPGREGLFKGSPIRRDLACRTPTKQSQEINNRHGLVNNSHFQNVCFW